MAIRSGLCIACSREYLDHRHTHKNRTVVSGKVVNVINERGDSKEDAIGCVKREGERERTQSREY